MMIQHPYSPSRKSLFGGPTLIALLFSVVAGCSDSAAPPNIPLHHLKLHAVTPTSATLPVGTTLYEEPAVKVTDLAGKAVSGVAVTFIVSGGGTIARYDYETENPDFTSLTLVVMSNSEGIARLGSWRIATMPALNIVTATSARALESIAFNITSVAGRASSVLKLAGDEQLIPAQTAALVLPRIRVLDSFNNGVAGVQVNFSVVGGGGSITGAAPVTDAFGIATLGSWIMGSEGLQTLSARIEGLNVQLTFTAALSNSPRACGVPATLSIDTTVQAELGTEACKTDDGKYFDLLTLNLSANSHVFTLESPHFDTEMQLISGEQLAFNDDAKGTSNSQIRAIVATGTYKLRVSSSQPGKTGTYFVRYSGAAEVISGCEEVYVTRDVNTYQRSGVDDCRGGLGNADRFRIFLKKGIPVEVQVEDLSYSDHAITLADGTGKILAVGTTGTSWWIYTLKFAAPSDGYYVFEVSSPDDGAEYVLTIR